MYKYSKFNFHCKNSNGELLLYNSFVGIKSVCKVESISHIQEIINSKLSFDEITMQKLLNRGIIVLENLNEELKLNSLINEIMSPKDLGLSISPTEKCNFRCKYCYESHNNVKMTNCVRDSIIGFVKNNMHKFIKLNVSWFGGEPTTELDIIKYLSREFINICKYNRRKYSSTMTTNGYLLDIETFKELLDCRVMGYQISIDGLKQIHDNQRPLECGHPTFEKIVNNLNEIKNLRNRNFHIVIRSNITHDIYNNIEEYLNLLVGFCEGDARFSVLINYATEWSDNIEKDFKDKLMKGQDDLVPIYQKIIETKKNINFTFTLNPVDGSCQLGRQNRYFIRPNAEVHKCTVRFENPKNIVGHIINGNMDLNSEYYEKLLNPNMCSNLQNCFYAPICKGEVCPTIRKNKTICPDSKRHLSYYLQLMDNYNPFENIG